MGRYEALEDIRETWEDQGISLGEKILRITSVFSSEGLDLGSTAAHLHATPAELDALLSLGELDESVIERISQVNPPKTAWTMLANANDEEIEGALSALEREAREGRTDTPNLSVSEFVYTVMLDIAGPTTEQRVGSLSGDVLRHALKKGEDFGVLGDWDKKFLKSVSVQRKRGKTMSLKQTKQLMRILGELADKGVIKRESIDGDQEICDTLLDALGR